MAMLKALEMAELQNRSLLMEANGLDFTKFEGAIWLRYPQILEGSADRTTQKRGGAFQKSINNRQKYSGYSLTSNIVSQSLQIFEYLYIVSIVTKYKNNKLQRCVSERTTNSRTQMAKARTSRLFSAAAGALAGAAVALTPVMSAAQDAKPTSASTEQVPDGWAAENWELHQAGQAVSKYARETPSGVGILLHVGDDLRSRAQAAAETHNVPVDHALQVMIARVEASYAEKFAALGVEARLFPRTNLDASATGLTYHIGQLVYEDASGNAVLNLGEANSEVPRVVEALNYLNRQAKLNSDQPSLTGFGG